MTLIMVHVMSTMSMMMMVHPVEEGYGLLLGRWQPPPFGQIVAVGAVPLVSVIIHVVTCGGHYFPDLFKVTEVRKR